jgi:hypothetical protein
MGDYEYEPDIPRIDEKLSPRKLHERCEQVAVPTFDWMSQPIVAIVDGLIHIEHHAHQGETHHRHWLWHRKDEPHA